MSSSLKVCSLSTELPIEVYFVKSSHSVHLICDKQWQNLLALRMTRDEMIELRAFLDEALREIKT